MKGRFSSACGAWDNNSDPLPRSFFCRPVLTVARDCIGKLLVTRVNNRLTVGRIVETEAYRGPDDRAAHSFGGRRTKRTEVMFGPAGFAYVFIVYGMHYNFNVVTGQIDQPQAVLVRAVEPISGLNTMRMRRPPGTRDQQLTSGPGKLCQAFGITKAHYGHDLTRDPVSIHPGVTVNAIRASPRIGVDYAGSWSSKPWRFFEADNPFVSRTR